MTGRDVNSRLCLMKNPLLYRSTRPESDREVRERLGSLEFRASGAIGLRWQAVFGCSHRLGNDAGWWAAPVESAQREVSDLLGALPLADAGAGGAELVKERRAHRTRRNRQDL